MNIDNITSEDMTLTYNGKAMQIKVYEEEIERLHTIIKEVREYITYWHYRNDFRTNSFTTGVKEELLKILDNKGSDNNGEN